MKTEIDHEEVSGGASGRQETGWDTDNGRLKIFLVLMALWIPLQFYFMAMDAECKQGEIFRNATMPFMLLLLFLTRRRSEKVINRLLILTFCALITGIVYIFLEIKTWPSPLLVTAGAGAFYFVIPRSGKDHLINLALAIVFFCALILEVKFPTLFRTFDNFYIDALIISVEYVIAKFRAGLLRPALALIIFIAAHEATEFASCPNHSRRYCSSVKSDLANLAIAEEEYFEKHGAYTKNLEEAGTTSYGFRRTKGVFLFVLRADKESYRMVGYHLDCSHNKPGALDIYYWDSANGGLQP